MGVEFVLGKGSVDYSGSGPDSWGTFISSKGPNEYNGTAHTRMVFNSGHYGSFQGLIYDPIRGGFIVPISRSAPNRTIEAVSFRCDTNGYFNPVKAWRYAKYNSSGTYVSIEVEGVLIIGDKIILGSNGNGWFEFPYL
jgi:hypothetical protein